MILILLRKELTLELRRKTVIAGIVLYLVSSTLLCYLTFSLRQESISPPVWSALLWLLMLFSIVNASAKSFIGERAGADIYMYSITSPAAIIFSKTLYNFILATLLAVATFVLFAAFLNNPVDDLLLFSAALLLGAGAISTTMTLVSGLAAKANNNNVLVAVLGFPLVISAMLPALKVTKNAIDGLDWSVSQPELIMLVALNCLLVAVSFLLFPYIWRS